MEVGSIFESLGDPIIITNVEGFVTGFNPAAETLYGYSTSEIVGRPFSILVPADRQAEHDLWIRMVAQEGRVIRSDTEGIIRGGHVIPVHATLSPIRENGAVIAVIIQTLDFSVRMSFQSLVHRERDLFEAILETTNDAILMVDTARIVLAANLQFEVFFNLLRYRFLNRPVEALVAQIREQAELPGDLANILLTYVGDSYQTIGGEIKMTGPPPRVLVWYSASVYAQSSANVGRLFVFRDATREREVDRMKTQFVSLVSHELRTPMTSIKGFTDMILDGDAGPIDDQVREYLDIVKINTDRLKALIDDTLNITRIETGRVDLQIRQCSVRDLINSVVQSLFPIIDSREQSLTVNLYPDLPSIRVDHEKIAQVLMNLLDNATKYSPKGSEITIDARYVGRTANLGTTAPTDIKLPAILVGVHDMGMGITETEQVQLFTHFYRTEEATRRQIAGTGLGLAIVKAFVELHKGRVWVDSEFDKGSSFYFTIPLEERQL
jgi:PAS domain S-box-containing protein